MTIGGLDATKKYSVAFYVHRNSEATNNAIYTLQDASVYVAASSTGVGGGSDADVSDEDIDISPDNDNGYIVRWDEIAPTGDSNTSFTIKIETADADNNRYVYFPQAVMIKTKDGTFRDLIPPEFTLTPEVADIAETTCNLSATINENGKIYYVVLANDAAPPTSAEVKAAPPVGEFRDIVIVSPISGKISLIILIVNVFEHNSSSAQLRLPFVAV